MVKPDDTKSEAAQPASEVRAAVQATLRPLVGTTLLDRFELGAKLGEGGIGQVFEAWDRERGATVAVKLLGRRTPHRLSLLKHEFRVAAELAHPNLVRLYELFSEGTDCLFSMELVRGATLPARLAHETAAREPLLRKVLGQLALGLCALHRSGTLHGDLKPSNFLISDADDRVVLLDFGLARSTGADQLLVLSGTPHYMAPEQQRVQVVTEAVDWYSFGVVMYEALCGVLPGRPPAVKKIQSSPPDLAMLCLALLQRDPVHRPTGEDVLRFLGVAEGSRSSSTPPAPALVGRERELGVLQQALLETRNGTPSIAFVQGPSGIGKTSLCEEFVKRARRSGAVVLTGRCRERETIGFKAIDSLIDDIVTHLLRLPESEARRVIPGELSHLATVFPALRAIRWIDELVAAASEPIEGALVRTRAAKAFGELFAQIARNIPLVVWLDDLQWSDADSASMLGPALGGPQPAPILFLGSYRNLETPHGPLLAALLADRSLQLPASSDIALAPLMTEDATQLARTLLPADHPDVANVARTIQRESGGHPLFIAELAYAQREGGPRSPASHITLVDLLSARVETLPESARNLLELVSVAGEPLPSALHFGALDFSAAIADEALHVLRAHRLARSHGADGRAIDVHHDRIREIVVAGLHDTCRRARHLQLAYALERWPESLPARQATHFEAAGETTRAGHYWILAADQAMHTLAFAHAAELYARGLRAAELGAEKQRAVQLRLADALSCAGKGPEAADVFLAIAVSSGGGDQFEFQRRAAEQLLLSGHLDRGLSQIEGVLEALGMRPTLGGRQAVAPLLLERAWLSLRGLEYVSVAETAVSPQRAAQLDASWTIARSIGLLDPIRGAEFQARHLALALRTGEPRRLLRALALEASYSAMSGVSANKRTAQLLAAAERIAATGDDEAARALLVLARGVAAYLQGNLGSAFETLQRALQLTDRGRGAVWERMSAQRLIIASLYATGRLRELASFVPPLLVETEGMGNLYATASFRTGYSTVAWLVDDRVHEADRQLELARRESQTHRFQLVHHNLLFGQTFRDLYSGDYERAHARIVEQWPKLRESMLLHVTLLRVHTLHFRGAAAAGAARARSARGEHAKAWTFRRDAQRMARALARDSFPRARPLARLIVAAVDPTHRREELHACVLEFERQNMVMYAAAARMHLAATLGGEESQVLRAEALAVATREALVQPARVFEMLAPGFQADKARRSSAV